MSEMGYSDVMPMPKNPVLRQTPPKSNGSDSSSREGSPLPTQQKRSFTPTSDDGDLVVAPVGEHIDDTPPPEGHPIIRQAVAFNWEKTAAASVKTYEAAIPPKPASHFLPGQAPVPVSAPASTHTASVHTQAASTSTPTTSAHTSTTSSHTQTTSAHTETAPSNTQIAYARARSPPTHSQTPVHPPAASARAHAPPAHTRTIPADTQAAARSQTASARTQTPPQTTSAHTQTPPARTQAISTRSQTASTRTQTPARAQAIPTRSQTAAHTHTAPVQMQTPSDTQVNHPPPQRPMPVAKAPARKTSSSRGKKAESKPRHFNDEFSTQTGRFKLSSTDTIHITTEVQHGAPTTHGSGPYSAMYRMGAHSPRTAATAVAGSVSPAPRASSSRSTNPSVSDGYSSASQSRLKSSSSRATLPAKSKASGGRSSSSSKRRSSTSTAHQQSAQPSQTHGSTSQYYRRDYERGTHTHGTSSSSNAYSQNARECAPGPPSANVVHTNLSSNNGNPPGHSSHVDQRPEDLPRPLCLITILIEDIRSGVTDHQLAEVRVPLLEQDDCLWVEAQDICEQLQASASRIYGPARAYTLRGKYRQFFLRVTENNVDEITLSNLKVSPDKTLDVVVETPPQQGVLPQPPQIPREVMPPSPGSDASGSSFPINAHSMQRVSSQEARHQLNQLVPMKRVRPNTPPGAPHQQFAHISPHNSPSRSQTPPTYYKKSKRAMNNSSYDYSQMSPRTAQYYQDYARNYNIPLPASPNAPGRMGSTEQEIDAAIVRYIKPLVEDDPQWMEYMESKAKPQRVSEVLKQYHFIQDKVDDFSGMRTPIHWDGAPALEVGKQHVWQLLNLESPYGPDCQETLNLLALYGPNGHHYEDSRVVDMINDTSVPTGKPYKRFLKLLRQIDEDWLNDHPELDTESNDSLGSISSGTGRDGDIRNCRDET